AVGDGIEKLVGMPARRERSGFRLAVTDHAGDDQVGIVVGRSVCVRDCVSEFSALVDRAWRLRSHVARNTTRKRELGEGPLHALLILRDVRVNFGISSLKVGVGYQARPAVSWASDVKHIKVVLFD